MRLPFPAAGLSPAAVPQEYWARPAGREGPFAPNTLLQRATRLFKGKVVGSESVAVAPDGTLWMLDKWGDCWTAVADPAAEGGYRLSAQPVAYVGPGRPLGFHFDARGRLLICDTKGLLRLERSDGGSEGSSEGGSSGGGGGGRWALRVLANEAGGRPIAYANDLDVSRGGTVYFTDSTVIPPALNEAAPRPFFDTMRSYMLSMFHGVPSGRLLALDPASGVVQVLEERLYFANGVALAPDESFVAVVETTSMRVWRRWLTGPKAGTKDVLIDRLPGFPDNITPSADGNFWLALVVPDAPLVHRLVRGSPLLRGLAARLPAWLQPKPKWGCVLKVSPEGRVLQCLMDPAGDHVSSVACAVEHGGKLFMGSLAGDCVSVLDLAGLPAAGGAAAAAAGVGAR